MGDHSRFWLSCLGTLGYLRAKTFELNRIPTFLFLFLFARNIYIVLNGMVSCAEEISVCAAVRVVVFVYYK